MTRSRDLKPGETLRDPTPSEARAIDIAKAKQAERPGRAVVSMTRDTSDVVISNPHSDPDGWSVALRDTFATTSRSFADDCMLRLTLILGHCEGGKSDTAINAALAMIGGFDPANEGQTALAVQIVVNHVASAHFMTLALRNANGSHVEAAAVFMTMATKASRTMAAHVEALAKLRGGGKQIIEHRYYQVNATNAVVGDHTQTVIGQPGAYKLGNEPQCRKPVALEHAPSATVPSAQPAREPLPVSSDAGT